METVIFCQRPIGVILKDASAESTNVLFTFASLHLPKFLSDEFWPHFAEMIASESTLRSNQVVALISWQQTGFSYEFKVTTPDNRIIDDKGQAAKLFKQ
ncbi:762_t:CDS:2 [Ambispora gerdemannii]|uniref:762_t:CDS:1 n=1 Tax=Ambispora gerdemannii TaxID=144530 RepID=A0A9N9AMB9_9GLOM|nr:762_t:CDS:2 [Ambispora gerdemannii]